MIQVDVGQWEPAARAIIAAIAKYNEKGMDLDELHLSLDADPSAVRYEISASKRSKRRSHYFGTLSEIDPNALLVAADATTLSEIDPNALLVAADATSAFVVNVVAEIIADSIEGYLNGEYL